MQSAVVIWIDWYPYHVARFRALSRHPWLTESLTGIEMVGGCGVHRNMNFRSHDRTGLPILTLEPGDWDRAGQGKLARRLWNTLERLSPRVVLIPGYYTLPALAAALWCKRRKRRAVLMTETTRADERRVWWKERSKRLLLSELFDWAIAGGTPHVRYLQELGFSSDRIARCYDVVDNDYFRAETGILRDTSFPDGFGLPEDYFLYVGRLSPEKHVDGLLRSYADYRSRGGRSQLQIVGDGPQRTELEALSREFGLQANVTFAGHKNIREIVPYYAFAKCFVLPSRREPWGLVTNEAMASSLPVIISDRCGCAEDLVRDGENGFRFSPENPEALTERMYRIDTAGPSRLRAMGAASSRIIDQFSPGRWAAEVARVVYA
jgi:glycosyltransferase involved in cell wall biosynthesis